MQSPHGVACRKPAVSRLLLGVPVSGSAPLDQMEILPHKLPHDVLGNISLLSSMSSMCRQFSASCHEPCLCTPSVEMAWPRERHGRSSAMTHRAQISWVVRLIVLAATRGQYGCWGRHSWEVSTLEHCLKTCLGHGREGFRLTHDSIRTEESSVTWIKLMEGRR